VSPELLAGADFKGLVKDMIKVMHAEDGVGLAAPQLGYALRVIVIEDRAEVVNGLSQPDRELQQRDPFDLKVLSLSCLRQLTSKSSWFR
jgi:hypothetical protein